MGPGGVLEAAIASGMIPVIDLRQIFRQAQESAIVTSAHAVNSGHFPDLTVVPPHLLQVWVGSQHSLLRGYHPPILILIPLSLQRI